MRCQRNVTHCYTEVKQQFASHTVLVGDLLEPYLRNYRNTGKKAEWRQRTVWKNLKPTFGEMPVAELATDGIQQYIESRRVGIADEKALLSRNGAVNRELALVKAMLTYGTSVTPRLVKPEEMPTFPAKQIGRAHV